MYILLNNLESKNGRKPKKYV